MSLIHNNAGKPQCRLVWFVDYGLGGHLRGSQAGVTPDSPLSSTVSWAVEGAASGPAVLLRSKGHYKQHQCCYCFFFTSCSWPTPKRELHSWPPLYQFKHSECTCCAGTLNEFKVRLLGAYGVGKKLLSCSEHSWHGCMLMHVQVKPRMQKVS